MRNFFKTIYYSISSPDFYQEVPQKSFWRTVGFYTVFIFFITIIRSLPFIFSELPKGQAVISQSISEFKANYPQDLIIDWDGSRLHANSTPQIIYYPEAFKKYFDTQKEPPYFGILATNQTEATPSADSIFTITQTDVITKGEGDSVSQVHVVDVMGKEPFQFTADTVSHIQNYWEAHKHFYLHVSQAVLPLMLFFVLLFQRLSMVLIESILFLLFKKFQGKPWTYATAIKYSLHFFIAAEFIDMVAQYVYPTATISLFSVTAWIYFLYITLIGTKKTGV